MQLDQWLALFMVCIPAAAPCQALLQHALAQRWRRQRWLLCPSWYVHRRPSSVHHKPSPHLAHTCKSVSACPQRQSNAMNYIHFVVHVYIMLIFKWTPQVIDLPGAAAAAEVLLLTQ